MININDQKDYGDEHKQMETPLVSVIIPVKNGELFLSAAIKSVLQQDYKPFEIIVVDGQSVDNTALIAKSYTEVRYILQSGDSGISQARNIGIVESKGELIAFISHDDIWLPNKLSAQVAYIIHHQKIQYTVTRVKFFLEPGCSIPPGFRKELLDGDYVGKMSETLIARRALFNLIGGFDPEITYGEDMDWFARAKDKNIPMAVIPEVLVYKRVCDSNVSYRPSDAREINRSILKLIKNSLDRQRNQGK